MKEKLSIEDISTTESSTYLINFKVLSNIFSVILSVPSLFTASIVASMKAIGIEETWIQGMLIAVVGVIFAFVFIKFVLGKDL